ncbi:MAG: CPBP family intramembrane metalloprotease [Acidobacteriales bacterium]|nr:CPBP family intramembrane metalloprotease [Terriglobales bacterium]
MRRKAMAVLLAIAVCESVWVWFAFRGGFARAAHWLGWDSIGSISPMAWFLAVGTTAAYCMYSRQLFSVRETMFRLDWLKLAAIYLAVVSALCEEGVFRKLLMRAFALQGHALAFQIIASALLFGLAHAVWGLLKGSWRAALGATVATSILGALLAIMYLLARRNLFVCEVSHGVINLLIEPGLILAALRGELGRRRTHERKAALV